MTLLAFDIGAAAPPIIQEQDGIVARLDVAPGDALFSWRFTRRPPALVDRIEASINGRPAGVPDDYQPFPAPEEATVVLFLIDTGGTERTNDIEGAERAILGTIKSLPRGTQPDVASYDSNFHAIDLPLATNDFRLALSPKDSTSNLSRGLNEAIAAAASTPAARRAIYVYTDGFNAEPRTLPDARALAISSGTIVTFVLTPSIRLADVASLDAFAQATRGKVLTRSDDVLADVSFLTSGARVRFPLDAARRLMWEPQAVLSVALIYGERRLMISHPVDVPVAGLQDTFLNLGRQDYLLPTIFGCMVSGVIFVLVWRRTSRRKAGGGVTTRGSLES